MWTKGDGKSPARLQEKRRTDTGHGEKVEATKQGAKQPEHGAKHLHERVR